MIRPAPPADAAACAGILNDWVDATDGMTRVHSHADVRHHSAERVLPRQTVWVTDAPVDGFLAAQDGGMVTALCLAPRARGLGRERALLDQAKTGRNSQSLWTFQANDGARRFCAANGVREVARTEADNEERLPDVHLAWAA